MGSSDFYIDYNIEVSGVSDGFKRETEQRLRELAATHSDMIGAAVSLEKVSDTQTYDVHRVRIVVYKRPQDIVVTKQDPDPMVTMRDALDTLEEQVRKSRDKLAQQDSHRDSVIKSVYYDLSADEIRSIFAISTDLKARHAQGLREPLLPGRVMALLFEKPSLRTRAS